MDIFGNKTGGGGYANPANTNLNMNTLYKINNLANGTDIKDAINLGQLTSYVPPNIFNQSLNTTDNVQFAGVNLASNKITNVANGTIASDAINLGQLTSYIPSNPFNQSLNTTDNVQFQNINMNGNWIIPNTQPSSPNDPNTYSIGARGGIITIPVLAYPKNCLEINLFRSSGPPMEIVLLPIPVGSYFYADLADIIKNDFNNLSGLFNGIVTCSYCAFFNNIFILTLNSTMAPPYNFDYQLQGTIYTDDISYLFGIINASRKNYGSPAYGTNPITYGVNVGWYSSSSSFPVQNGSPYIYSAAQDKWYNGEVLYTPNFINYVDFNNAGYSLVQNGFNKLIMSETQGTELWGIGGSNGLLLNANGVTIRNNAVNRVRIDSNNLHIYSANLLNYLNINNTDINLGQGAFVKLNMNEDQTIGTSLWGPSNSGRLHLQTTGITLHHNSVNRFVIDNTESYSFSPSLLNIDYISNTEISSIFNMTKRVKIDAVDSEIYSPNAMHLIKVTNSAISFNNVTAQNSFTCDNAGIVYAFNNVSKMIMNANNFLISNGATNRLDVNGSDSKIISANGSNLSFIGNNAMTHNFANIERIKIDSSKVSLLSPSNVDYVNVSNNSVQIYKSSVNRLTIDVDESIIYSPTNSDRLSVNDVGLLFIKSGVVRLHLRASGSEIYSPNGSSFVNIGDDDYECRHSGTERIRVTTTESRFNGPLATNYATLILTGSTGTLACSGGYSLNTNGTSASINSESITRILTNPSHTQIISPNGLQLLEVNNTGVQINLGSDNYKLPTTRGTVGQVLTYSGVNTSWASPGASNNAGFSLFNPLYSTATITTGNKPYWYIVMVPCNCIITGFKTVMASGTDPFHVGIYRGKTTNSATTVLDLLAPIVTVVGGGFYTSAFVLQAGRSNVYTAGEYITVMYHSQGSTNSFYNNLGPSDVNLAWTTTANYGNATPPSNLGSVAVLGATPNRLAIEFY